jgi:hypothetical protein
LESDQSVSGSGIDLKNIFCDGDIFTGGGNATWKFTGPSCPYYILIDAFSGHFYARAESSYPVAIYMDGWGWKKHPGDPRSNWDFSTAATLYRQGTSNIYEATIYLPWAGDFNLWAASSVESDRSKRLIRAKYFEGVEDVGNQSGIYFPGHDSSVESYYKMSVDFKDGFTFDTENEEDNGYGSGVTIYTLVPTNGKKFTITFTKLE